MKNKIQTMIDGKDPKNMTKAQLLKQFNKTTKDMLDLIIEVVGHDSKVKKLKQHVRFWQIVAFVGWVGFTVAMAWL